MTDTAATRERVLIGALLSDNSQIQQVSLTAKDFTIAAHGQIFDVTRRLIGAGKVTDALTVAEALEQETGRKDWLRLTAEMVGDCLAPANAPAYAAMIKRGSISRQAAEIGERLTRDSGSDETIATAIRDLLELSSTDKDHVCHILEAMQDAMNDLSSIEHGQIPGVRTGIRDLDESLGGMHKGDLIVIPARPAMGKTAFMLNLARSADCGVGVISGEQGRAQVGMRMMAIGGPVSLHRMRTAGLENDEWSRVAKAMSAAKDKPMWIFDKPAPTITEIVSQARAWKFHNNIGVLMVDYLQKIRGGGGKDFRLQIGDIAVQLKDLARELEIPVVALAQVKREVESRPMGDNGMGRMPFMADIAEAAIIEQEADQVITLYRPEVYSDEQRFVGIAYTNICKNRHGPVGFKEISWRGEYLQFGDLAKTELEYRRYA